MTKPNIVLICDDSFLTTQLLENLSRLNIKPDILLENSIHMQETLHTKEPMIIFLVNPPEKVPIFEIVSFIKNINPDHTVILLLSELNLSLFKKALKSGVADVIKIPDEINNLPEVVEGAIQALASKSQILEEQQIGATARGRLVAVYSAKGGSGKTVIAVHLAQALPMKTSQKVLLVDLNLQFGGVQNFLDIQGQRNIIDLIPVIDELNINHFNNVVIALEQTGVEVLLGPANPELAESITEEHIASIFAKARKYYDFVVVDLPSEMNISSLSTLNLADQILYVTMPDSPSLYVMKSAFEIFAKCGLAEEKISLVINRVSNKNDINVNDIAQLSHFPTIARIRSDFLANQTCINLGKPLFKSLQDKGMTRLARDILLLAEKVNL